MGLLRRHQRSGSHTEQAGPAGPAAGSDGRLVSLAQQDPGAFGPIYDRYFPAVYGYCLSELRDPEIAADAAGQTFLKAMAALPGYREGGRFRSWLFAIAHNVIMDAHPTRLPDEQIDTIVHIADPAPSPEDAAIRRFDLESLDDAIAHLPDADREVIELRRAGLSGKEIAAVLGVSHEAAKKRQLRAIDRLRQDLLMPLQGSEVRRGA
jgi:RNA polymerase sigma-70 factor (ECF subfamily)